MATIEQAADEGVLRTRKRLPGALGTLLVASPLLFGIPVALGIAVSVVRLLATAHPDLGWTTIVNNDAEVLYLGHTLYQNPAHGYTGSLYTPLFPALVSVLLHVRLWNGWTLLLTIAASLSLVTLTAWVAYQPAGSVPRLVRVASAAGIGGVAYWCVSSIRVSLLDEGAVDQLAWAFALFGLVAVAGVGPASSRRRVVFAALLVSGALWTKQTTVVVAVVAVAWMWGLVAMAQLGRKTAWLFTAVLGGLNLLLLIVLNLLTEGWELYMNFEMGFRHATFPYYKLFIAEGLRSCVLAVGLVGAVWLVWAAARAGDRQRAPMRPSLGRAVDCLRCVLDSEHLTGRLALLVGLYLPFGFALAVYCIRKQGASDNEFIGVVWALGLLAASGWRMALRDGANRAAVAGGCVAAYFALVQLGPVRALANDAGVVIPPLSNAVHWPQVPSPLRSWARDHTLYTPRMSDLNVANGGPLYPSYYNVADLLAAGNQPLYLVHALLDRRFDGVEPFAVDEGGGYTSAYGKWEENYMWKLDQVIAARYVAERGLPHGVLGRRPGPERGAWMRRCFGPFTAGGAKFRIHRGGGFWCSFAPGQLRLVSAPTRLSEVVTTQPIRAAATIMVSLDSGPVAQVEVVRAHAGLPVWVARVASAPGKQRQDLEVSTSLGDRPLGSTVVTAVDSRDGQRSVRLDLTSSDRQPGPPSASADGTVELAAPAVKAELALVASQGTDVIFTPAAHGPT